MKLRLWFGALSVALCTTVNAGALFGIQPPEIAAWTAEDKKAAKQKADHLYANLLKAIASEAREFVIPKDNYLISKPFIIEGAENLHIKGNGATFWAVETGELKFIDCNNCTVENLIFDRLNYPFVQGIVSEIVPQKNGDERIVLELEPGSTRPNQFSSIRRTLCKSAATGKYYYRAAGYGQDPDAPRKENQWIWKRVAGAADRRAPSMQIGDRVAMHAYYPGDAGMSVFHCGNMNFVDISVYSASGFQVKEFGVRSPGNNHYTRLKIMPRPGSSRIACAPKDGFHSYNQKIGPTLIDCEIAATYDDGINIHGFINVVLKQTGPKELLIASEFGRDYEIGSELTFYKKPTMAELSKARVVAFEPIDPEKGKALLATATQFFRDEYNTPIRESGRWNEYFKVTLDHPVKMDDFDLAISPDYCGAGAHIKNLYMHDGCNRGMLIKAPGAVIEESRFEDIFFGGLYVVGEVGPLEADFADGVVIRNNRFINCGYYSIRTPHKIWNSFAPITVLASTAPKKIDAYLHLIAERLFSDLTITGNRIEDSPGIAIFVGNTQHANISSNTIVRPLQEEWLYPNLELNSAVERKYAPAINAAMEEQIKSPLYGIYLVASDDIVLKGNRIKEAPESMKAPVGKGPWTSNVRIMNHRISGAENSQPNQKHKLCK